MDGSTGAATSGASAARKVAPYLFQGQTTSLCETCLALVPAKIISEGDDVFYLKRCREHGVQKTLISDDLGYWKAQKDWLKPGDRPLGVPDPHRARLPLRLRPLPRPRAALLPGPAAGDRPVPGAAVRAVDRLGGVPAAGHRDHADDRALAAGRPARAGRPAQLPRLAARAAGVARDRRAGAHRGAAPGADAVRRHAGDDRPDRRAFPASCRARLRAGSRSSTTRSPTSSARARASRSCSPGRRCSSSSPSPRRRCVLEVLLTFLMAFFMIEARVRVRRRLLLDRQHFGASLKAARVMRDVQDRVGRVHPHGRPDQSRRRA